MIAMFSLTGNNKNMNFYKIYTSILSCEKFLMLLVISNLILFISDN